MPHNLKHGSDAGHGRFLVAAMALFTAKRALFIEHVVGGHLVPQ